MDRAAMRLPGEAWLEWRITADDGGSRVPRAWSGCEWRSPVTSPVRRKAVSSSFRDNFSFNRTFEKILRTIENQCDYCSETGASFGNAIHLAE